MLMLSMVLVAFGLAACGGAEDEPAEGEAEPPATDSSDDGRDEADGEAAEDDEQSSDRADDADPDPERDEDAADERDEGSDGEEAAAGNELPDPAEVEANELGHVPVLMYHGIVEEPADEWQMTPEAFREELEFLHEHGYHPIRTVDLVRGEIDIPAGRSPVVLTFDDTLPTQFDRTDDGEVDPESAVGIMLDFGEEHPEFPAVGSFYVTDKRFDDPEQGQEMFAELHELGFEVGNHTIGHQNLGTVDSEEVQRQLALGAEQIREVVPGGDVATMSLPLGVWPEERELARTGAHDGIEYEHEGILLVGSDPAPSPFAEDFDPLGIPRILAQRGADGPDASFMSEHWLEWLEEEPGRKYVSDGDPETISFPEDDAERLDPEHADRANPYEP
ncbi:polysaccharide deacetylase family protein [Egibacter rhizosphaerae]|nr:polysaccharide deacetylase family protein [Egibacter rhizosphaerae]